MRAIKTIELGGVTGTKGLGVELLNQARREGLPEKGTSGPRGAKGVRERATWILGKSLLSPRKSSCRGKTRGSEQASLAEEEWPGGDKMGRRETGSHRRALRRDGGCGGETLRLVLQGSFWMLGGEELSWCLLGQASLDGQVLGGRWAVQF